MRTRRSAMIAGLLTLLLSATPSVACAQRTDADALISRGNALRRAGRDEDALPLYRQAWEVSRSPYARAEIALAEAATGRWREAADDLDAALAAPDAWIARHRGVLDAVRSTIAQHLGTLELTCDVAHATVDVDGRTVGVTPLPSPLRLAEGEVTVVVRADGRPLVTRRLTITANATTREHVSLASTEIARAEPPPTGATLTSTPGVAPRRRVAIPITDDERTTPLPAPPSGVQSALGWTAAALAGVSFAVGVGALVAQRDGRAQLPAYNGCTDQATCLDLCTRVDSCRSQYESEEAWRAVAWTGFIVGGALSAAAVALLVTAPADAPPTARARASCGLSLASPSLTCTVRF